jgi:DNA-directed RNA polymerase subunit K/omega
MADEDTNVPEIGYTEHEEVDMVEQEDLEETNVPEEISPLKKARNILNPLANLYKHHPECVLDYSETIAAKLPLRVVPANPFGTSAEPADPYHRTQPFLTLYEKAKIIGFRAEQIAGGARPFVAVPDYMTDPRDIARLELEQRRLPYIVKRPLPNGEFEYWRLSDLMIL